MNRRMPIKEMSICFILQMMGDSPQRIHLAALGRGLFFFFFLSNEIVPICQHSQVAVEC